MSHVTRDELVSDVKVVINDVEALLKQAAGASGAQAQGLRERAAAALNTGQAKMREMQNAVVGRSKATVKATDTWVHEHPWRAIGMAAGVGCLIGWLVSRR